MGALDDSADVSGDSGSERSEYAAGESNSEPPGVAASTRRKQVIAVIVCAALLGVVLPPLFSWQSENQQMALSLANMRRVSNGCLYYAQDWDERMPPPSHHMPDGFTLTWSRLVRPYVMLDEAFSNPANPVKPFHSNLRNPVEDRTVDTSYALNRRLWGQFSSGPFPFGNLEIPEQTALLVEAGRMAADPRHPGLVWSASPGIAFDLYGDTTDRVLGLSPYPSVHGGQSCVVAADGHGIAVKVLYYGPQDGPHDRLLGRIGENIYDWNGGYANGETDRPAHE
jgi:hypothetical protein